MLPESSRSPKCEIHALLYLLRGEGSTWIVGNSDSLLREVSCGSLVDLSSGTCFASLMLHRQLALRLQRGMCLRSLLRESNVWYESTNEVLAVWSASACGSVPACVDSSTLTSSIWSCQVFEVQWS